MKRLLKLGLLLALVLPVRAADFPIALSLQTVNQTNTVSSFGVTYSVAAFTNDISFASFHTWQFTQTSTNAATNIFERSLNGSLWFPSATNTFSTSGTGEQTMTGKWNYFRMRYQGSSNVTASFYYLGARQ